MNKSRPRSTPKVRTKDGRTFERWTKADLTYLRERHASMPDEEIAKRVGKTLKAVRSKACRLGLHKGPARLVRMGRENVAKRWS